MSLGATASAGGATAGLVLLSLLGVLGYFLPIIIASSRKVSNTGSVAVINIFLGWTLIGWVVALAMACGSRRAPSYPQVPPYPREQFNSAGYRMSPDGAYWWDGNEWIPTQQRAINPG